MRASDVSPWFLWGVYLFGFALILTAAIDLTTTVWPMRPDQAAWRYGFLGLAAGYMQTPTLGLILIVVAAHLDERPRIVASVGMVCLATCVILVGCMGVFALDVLQVRAMRAGEAQGGMLTGAVFQELKYAVSAGVFGLLGLGARRSAKTLARRMEGQR
ncbi:MAG: hypothetical protein AAF389_16095 [Gemmatimonadota bacterium]